MFLTWIPSPLKDIRETTLQCLAKFPRNMTAMLDVITPRRPPRASSPPHDAHPRPVKPDAPLPPAPFFDPSLLPEHVVLMIAVAIIVFRRSVRFVSVAYPQGKLIEGGRLEEAGNIVRGLGRVARFIITQGEKALGDFEYGSSWANAEPPLAVQQLKDGEGHGHGHGGGHGPQPLLFDLDIMNWDLSVLYPDLATMDLGL